MPNIVTSHFWVGQFPEELVENYFEEIYDEDDEDHENTPLSEFAKDQGVKWYDHDFLEHTWGTAETIQELVANSSYSDQWSDELTRRVTQAGLTGVNLVVFINDEEIENPQSVKGDGYWLLATVHGNDRIQDLRWSYQPSKVTQTSVMIVRANY